MLVAVDVEHGRDRAVEGVVVAWCRHGRGGGRWPAARGSPSRSRRAGSSASRQAPGGLEEEGVDPRLAVRHPVAEKAQRAGEARVGRLREVGVGIERVVDRHAAAGAQMPVGADHRIAAAIGADEVEARGSAARNGSAGSASTRSSVAGASTSQNSDDLPGPAGRQHAGLELGVEHPDAARLDQHVELATPRPRAAASPSAVAGQTTTRAQSRIRDVAMLLPLVGVGLEEGDLVPARRQRLEQPAIIGGGAVPVGRDQARAVEADPQGRLTPPPRASPQAGRRVSSP